MRVAITDEVLVLRAGRCVPWSEVFAVRWTRRWGRVATSAGVLRVGREQAAEIEARIAPWLPQRAAWLASLSPAERAEWFGMAPGETLRVTPARTGLVIVLAMLAAVLAALLVVAIAGQLPWFGLGCGLGVGLLAGYAVASSRPGRADWVADEAGLTIGRQRLTWSDVLAIETFPTPTCAGGIGILLLTRRGRFLLMPKGESAERLRQGLARCLVAQQMAVPAAASTGTFYPSSWLAGGGVQADERGLWRVTRWGSELIEWGRVKGAQWLGHGAQVLLDGGRKFWLGRLLGVNRLAEAIDRRLHGDEPVVDDQGELRADVIERWLGVPPGGSIHCRLTQWATLGIPILLICLIASLMASGGSAGLAGNLPQFILMLVFIAGSARSVRADAQGLSIRRAGRREYFAWSEIESLRPDSYGTVINTTRGPVKLSSFAQNQGLILGIINRILTARASGAALPDQAPMPETALSRITGTETAEVDRGLSVAER